MKLLRISLSALLAIAASGCQGLAVQGLIWDEGQSSGERRLEDVSSSIGGLRVLWWNIKKNELNSILPDRPLDANLQGLTSDPRTRPEVIALGECGPGMLEPETEALLASYYPYRANHDYNPETPGLGLCIYSAYRFKESAPRLIDWVPPALPSEIEREAYRAQWRTLTPNAPVGVRHFTREYRTYAIELGDQRIVLAPFHDLQPWDLLTESGNSFTTAAKIVLGHENPLVHQLRRLIWELQDDFGPGIDSEALLLIGDFNVPKRLGPLRAVGYELLSEHLSEAFAAEPFTFPARSEPKRDELPYSIQQLKLDHAFVSRKAEFLESEVLRLRGSDHYPLYVVVAPKQ